MDMETWNRIVAKLSAGRLDVKTATKDGKAVLLAKSDKSAKCVMRFEDTGSVFPCKFDKKTGKWKPKPAGHSWIKATGESIEQMLKVMGFSTLEMAI